MRLDLFFGSIAIGLLGAYFAFIHFALQGMPLNQDLAYEALVRKLGQSLAAGKEQIRLAQVEMLQRPHEVIFMGEGTLGGSRRSRAAVSQIEKLEFRYIVIITRHCAEWDANCYKAEELNLSAEENVFPMI
jgi:hypothetical protein